MGSKLKDTGVEFPDGTEQTTAATLNETVVFYKSGTFVKPAGVKYFEVILVGGGGGGGHKDISTDLPDTNGGSSVFHPTEDNPPYHEQGTHIAEGGKGGKGEVDNLTLSPHHPYMGGEAGYLGEPGSVVYQHVDYTDWDGYRSGDTVTVVDPDDGTLSTEVVDDYWTGGGQGGKCYINNIKGGVGEFWPKFESSVGTGLYDAHTKNSSTAQRVSWSGGGGSCTLYLYTGDSYENYPDDDDEHTDHAFWKVWHGGDGGQGTVANDSYFTTAGYPLEKSLAGAGHGWKLSSSEQTFERETDTNRYEIYYQPTNFKLTGGIGYLGGGGASLYASLVPPPNLQNWWTGGGGGGPGADGGACGGGLSDRGGEAGEVKSFSISTASPEKSYTIVIGKGGNGGWRSSSDKDCGGGGGAQGICIIKY